MTDVDTLKKKVKSKIPKKESNGNLVSDGNLICDGCGNKVGVVSIYGKRSLCLRCEREL